MAKKSPVNAVTPAQAKWIVERLIADGRISPADIQKLLSTLGDEIASMERSLAGLREAAGQNPGSAPAPRREGKPVKTRKSAGRKKGHPRGIAGTLTVLLRAIPAAEHAAIQAIRADKGIKAAIEAARLAAKK